VCAADTVTRLLILQQTPAWITTEMYNQAVKDNSLFSLVEPVALWAMANLPFVWAMANLPFVLSLSNAGKKWVNADDYFVPKALYVFAHSFMGTIVDKVLRPLNNVSTATDPLMGMLKLIRRISLLGAFLVESDSPNVKADAILALNCIYIGSETLFELFNSDLANNLFQTPESFKLIQTVAITALGMYSLFSGLKRVVKLQTVNPVEYAKSHPITKQIVNSTYLNGLKVFPNTDFFLSHPTVTRELEDHVSYFDSSSKKIVDVALLRISNALNDYLYVASFLPVVKSSSEKKYIVFAKGSRAVDHNQLFIDQPEFFQDLLLTCATTRSVKEICKLMKSVRESSGTTINGLVIQAHGDRHKGMHLGSNSNLDFTNSESLAKCIQKTMDPGAPVILTGCSTELLAKDLAEKSGHPVYGSLRDFIIHEDGAAYFLENDGHLGITSKTEGEAGIFKKFVKEQTIRPAI
jgi:hypothetical protein